MAPDPAQIARRYLSAQYAAAKKSGTPVTYRGEPGGQLPNYSGLNDDQLAAMVNAGRFTRDERTWAQGELNARVSAALAPWSADFERGDTRGFHKAVGALYDRMDPEVRTALGWTPQMRMAADDAADDATSQLGPIDEEAFWWMLSGTQENPSALQLPRLDSFG